MRPVGSPPDSSTQPAGRPDRQAALASRWADQLKGQTARARALTATLDHERLHWRPPDGGWGPGHILEHLVVTADSYLPSVRHLAAEGPAAPDPASVRWKGTLGGRFLVHALKAPRKLPAPRVFQVSEPRAQVVEAFVDRQDEIGRLLVQSRERHWRKCRLASPASSLIRLNLGDVFLTILTHNHRHLLQLERALRHTSFPRSL